MIRRRLLPVVGVLLAAQVAPARLGAQVVMGQVIDSTSGLPVGTGFVVLIDTTGNEVARTLGSSDGRFTLQAPTSGIYSLRSECIGYRASTSSPLRLQSDSELRYTLAVVALPVMLATVAQPAR